MARYTQSYKSFIERLEEIKTLCKIAKEKEKKDALKYRNEINALSRSSLVLLSSHLEAYIEGIGGCAIDAMFNRGISRKNLCDQFYYFISRELLEQINDSTDPGIISKKVFHFLDKDLQFWSKDGPFPVAIPADKFNKGFSNPKFDKIKKYFYRFGYVDYDRNLSSKLKHAYHPTKNMINHLVDLRNQISHGDHGASKTPSEIEEMLKIITVFCRSTDSLFATWWGKKFCTIR